MTTKDIQPQLTETAIKILEKRYFVKDENGNPIENASQMFRRVADYVASAEKKYGKTKEEIKKIADEFYGVMARLEALPNSPCLMSAGVEGRKKMLSACFVIPVTDSLDEIFDAIKNVAMIHKAGGGCVAKGSYVIKKGNRCVPIETVEIGDYVLSYNTVKGESEFRKVIQTHRPIVPYSHNITINLENRTSFTTSLDHPTLVYDGKQLKYIKASELKINDLCISSNYYKNNLCIHTENVPQDIAWFVGAHYGDGSTDLQKNIYKNKFHGLSTDRKNYRLRMLSADKDVVMKFANIYNQRDNKNVTIRKNTDKRYKSEVWEMGTLLIKENSFMNKYIEHWGKKSDKINVPDFIFKADIDAKLSFIAGLIDTDGYVDKKRFRIKYGTISKDMYESLLRLLNLMGVNCIHTRITKRLSKTSIIKDVNTIHPLYEININDIGFLKELEKYMVCLKKKNIIKSYNNRQISANTWVSNAFIVKLLEVYKQCVQFDKVVHDKLFYYHKKQKISRISNTKIEGIIKAIQSDKNIDKMIVEELKKQYNILKCCKAVISITKQDKTINEEFCDLTVENNNNYFAGFNGLAVVHNTGMDYSRLRGKNSRVGSTKGVSSGAISFMEVFDSATNVIKQGGLRKGANLGLLRIDHPDIEEFITCKSDLKRLNNFNISVGLTDKFIECVKKDKDFDLICPATKKVIKTVKAKYLWNKIVDCAWNSGEPGILFLDTINEHNPLPEVDVIRASNPCGEVPMSDWNSCNLMSINLAKFVSNNEVDYKRLGEIVKTATRFLDNVIDVNEYPLQKITDMSLNSRSIGLGIMGLADMLAMLMIPYASEQGRQKASEVFKFIHETSINTSKELAKEKGNFPFISKSIFKNEKYMRNSTHTVVAPTGTISLFVDASSGCEPYFALAFNKNVMDGESFTFINPYLEKTLSEKGLFDEQIKKDIAKTGSIQHIDKIPKEIKEIFKISNEIDVKDHIAMQSELQKHCSLAISKTINLHKEATKEEVAEAYMYAHKMGCKGVTVYRDGCRQNQVLTVGVEKENKKEEHNNEVITRGAVPERPECLECEIHNITVKGTPYVVLAGIRNGQLYEVFVDYALKSDGELRIPKNIEKGLICKVKRGRFDLQIQHEDGLQTTLIENIAGTFDSTAGTLTRMVSLALQSGATLERIVEQLSKSKDMVNFSKALMRVIKHFIKDGEIVTVGDTKCPECGASLRYESGCVSCSNKDCGWSRCS